jgi:TolB protein
MRMIRARVALILAGVVGLVIWAVQVPSSGPPQGLPGTIVGTLEGQVTGAGASGQSALRLLGVQFVDDRNGFLLRCYERGRHCPRELAVTHDRGRTWRTVAPADRLLDPTFVSRTTGFAVTRSCRPGRCVGRLLRTDDAGRSFQPVGTLPFPRGTVPAGESASTSFVDRSHGWIAAAGGVFATADGGASWDRLPLRCPDRFQGIGSVSFVDARTGFATCEGEPAIDMSEKALYRTADGGETWQLVSAAELGHNVGRLPWIGTAAQISFFSDRIGFIVAGRLGLARTDDGGQTFRTVLFTDDVDDVAGTSWVSPAVGYAALYQGQLLRSTDGGRHWKEVYPRTPPRPVGPVIFLDPTRGIGAGTGGFLSNPGAILATDDGGTTWQLVAAILGRVDALGAVPGGGVLARVSRGIGHGQAVTDLYRSDDEGRSWRRIGAPGGFLWSVSAPSASVMFAVDSHARLFRTGDGGRSWTRVGPARLASVDFVSRSEGWAEPWMGPGRPPTDLLHTTDGGKTWVRLPLPTGMPVFGMDFLNGERGWVGTIYCPRVVHVSPVPGKPGSGTRCGTKLQRLVLRTTDGGATWTTIRLPSSSGIGEALQFVSSRIGFVFPYRTTDGGVTWRAEAEHPSSGSATPGEASDRVLFEQWRNGTWDIAVADPSTSEVSQLTNTRKHENGAAFSPDDSLIAFTKPGPENYDLFVMNRDGTGRRRLTGGKTGDMFPDWSPDGTQIACSALPLGMGRVRGEGIWVLDVATGARRRLSYGGSDQGAQWSPDGSKVLFYGRRGGNYELMLADTSGGSVERLTDNRRDDLFPRWDADGTSILFTRTVDGDTYRRHLFRLDLSTGTETRVTPKGTSDEAGMVSPDGALIAFLRCPGTTCALWVMNADGSDQRELFGGGVDGGRPVWSPDGARLAFSHLNARRRYDISTVDVGSGEVAAVTRLRGDEVVTDWG